MAKRQITALLLLDSETAFDSVWIEDVMHKLETYELNRLVCKLHYSYLKDRQIQARVGKTISPLERIESGVHQGSVLTPLFYNLCIVDLMTDTSSPYCCNR